MNDKKDTVLLTVVAIATLIVAVIGATFAYFQAQGGAPVTRNVTIITETADNSSFSIDRAVELNINQQNFAQGLGDVSSTPANGVALFTASTGAAGELCYTLGLTVSSNNFIYTDDPETQETGQVAELLLTVTRATVENASSAANLTYGTPVTVIDGLDVTTLTGTIYIPATATSTTVVTPSNKGDLGTVVYYGQTGGPKNVHKLEATAGNTTSHKYVVTLTADNKDYDQQTITNKTFSGTLTFTQVSCTGA